MFVFCLLFISIYIYIDGFKVPRSPGKQSNRLRWTGSARMCTFSPCPLCGIFGYSAFPHPHPSGSNGLDSNLQRKAKGGACFPTRLEMLTARKNWWFPLSGFPTWDGWILLGYPAYRSKAKGFFRATSPVAIEGLRNNKVGLASAGKRLISAQKNTRTLAKVASTV